MREITCFYDGAYYTFVWMKAMLWAKNEFYRRGYRIKFLNLWQYMPIKGKAYSLKKSMCTHKFDIVLIAHHHTTREGFWKLSIEQQKELLQTIRESSKMVLWCDTSDSTGTTQFEVLPYVDRYLKKQIYKDMSIYTRKVWGGEYLASIFIISLMLLIRKVKMTIG